MEMETRLTILEAQVAELRALVPLIHAMDKKLDVLAMRKECPAPGLCLGIEPRVRALEDQRNRLGGALAAVSAISGAIGAAIAMLISWMKH